MAGAAVQVMKADYIITVSGELLESLLTAVVHILSLMDHIKHGSLGYRHHDPTVLTQMETGEQLNTASGGRCSCDICDNMLQQLPTLPFYRRIIETFCPHIFLLQPFLPCQYSVDI